MTDLASDPRFELRLVDDESLMPPLGNDIDTIMRLHGKEKLLTVDGDELDRCGDFESRRRCGFVAHIDVDADALLIRPIEMRIDRLDAGPFEETNEKSGCENFRHHQEFAGLGIECGNRLRPRNDKLVLVAQAGLERWLQVVALRWTMDERSPRVSRPRCVGRSTSPADERASGTPRNTARSGAAMWRADLRKRRSRA